MAKQKSYLKLRGTLDELTFYESNGKHYVRRKGGIEKDRILKDKAFKRTRENMNEFKGASKVATELRFALSELISQLGGTTVMGRLLGIMRKIIGAGPGIRGKRPLLIFPKKQLLDGFEFNEKNSFRSVFQVNYDVPTVDENRSVTTWTVPPFNWEHQLTLPTGASHYQFVLATVVLTDFQFSEEKEEYLSVDPELMLKRAVAQSDLFEAEAPFTEAITLTTDLELAEAMPETAVTVTVAGLLFFQEVDGQLYSLNSEQSLRVLKVA